MTVSQNSIWIAARVWAMTAVLVGMVFSSSAAASPAGPKVEHAWSMGDGKHLRVLFSEAMEPGAAGCPGNYTMGPETTVEQVRLIGSRCIEVTVDRLPVDYRARISMKNLTDATSAHNPLAGGSGVIVVASGNGVSYPMLLTPEGRLLNAVGYQGHAQLQGGATVQPGTGPFGGPALALDGVSGYATAEAGVDLGDGDFTIMLWLNPEDAGGRTVLAKDGGFWGRRGWRVFIDGANRSIALRLNGAVCRTAAGALPPQTWTHVAFIRLHGYTFAYVNGQPSGARCDMTGTGGLGNRYPLRIGCGHRKSDGYWQGRAACVKILAEALKLTEIRAEARFRGGNPAGDGNCGCLFNHGLLRAAQSGHNTPEQFKSYIRDLRYTDVDAVLYCPQMWRLPVFPSKVDQTWKAYRPGQPVSRFAPWDGVMTYLHEGGDPVRDTLEACRENGRAFFISYRMNDDQHTEELDWPSHPDFWRNHPDYWLGRGETDRVSNFMLPQVRDHCYAVLEEICTNYDIDGLELDFQRSPRFFHDVEIAKGTPVMTGFVKRVHGMLDRLGKERGKVLKLCVRVPQTIAGCEEAGLDVVSWDADGLIDMINVSPSKVLTLDLGIEEFQARTKRARIYAEMNYVTDERTEAGAGRPYSTPEAYRNAALNFFARGADGLSFYNFTYAPADMQPALFEALAGITQRNCLEIFAKPIQ